MKQKLLTLMTLLLCAVSGAWATDIVDKYTGIKFNTSDPGQNVAALTYGGEVTVSSSSLQVDKGKTGTFTLTVKPAGYVIKSIKFHEKSSSKVSNLSSEQGTIGDIDGDNWFTFTPSADDCTTATISYQGNGGKAQIDQVWTTLTNGDDNDSESLVFTEADDSDPKNLTFTSTLGASSKITTCTSTGGGISDQSGIKVVKVGKGKNVRIVASRPIKQVLFSWYQRCPASNDDWTGDTGSFDYANCTWTAANSSTTDVTFTRNVSNEAQLTNVHVIYQPSGPQDGVFTISKSSLEVGKTAKILLNGNDNFSTYFTATSFWEPVATGPYVSLTSDGTVTAIKQTPEGYYFTFTANSKDLEKYNTTTNNSITVAVTAPKCATPTIYPADGGTFVGSNSVTINTETDGASIYYTLDGTTPTSGSTLYDPANKPTITTTTTVKAIAVKADYDDSDVATAKITKVITSTVNEWDFSNWSDATKTGVQADATNWYNKEADGDGKLDFTEAGHIGRSNKNALENGALEYSGTAVAETDGLKFTAPATSMALMFDQPNTTIGTYNGNQYIWLYGKNSKIIIKNVPAGATIRMGVETHKTGTGRGVDLSGSSGITLTEGVDKPTSYSDNEWSVPNGGDITITPNVGGCHIYYITVKKNKEIENVSSFGWSTYITKTAVAFDANTAYVITNVEGSSITTAAVTSVPANTAVLLKDEGEKTIDPQTSASDPETNLLSVCDGNANGTKVPYVLAKDGASAGFKKWTGDIAKLNGRVVLWLDAEVAARNFFSLDETTGINKVSQKANTDNQYYNLAGQRVAQPTKGLYIVNGKKVVIK